MFRTDAAPVVEETAQLLIAEPKKKRGGRPVKPAAAQGLYCVCHC